MGNVTHKEAGELEDKFPGITETLQGEGIVGQRRRNKARFMLNGNKKKVQPTLYFKGHGLQGKDTKKMTELREKWTELVTEYTKEEK
jgi:hypothetical protein